jgi:hypothetical protein
MYCLHDGNALIADQSEPETPTVVRPPRRNIEARTPYLKYLVIAVIGILAVTAASGVGALIVWNWVAVPHNETSENKQPAISPTPRVIGTQHPVTPSPSKTTTSDGQTTPSPTKTPERSVENDSTDPGTARINFRSGRVSETVSGLIATSRSFVLRTLRGQRLSASVNSEGDCVVFDDGSTFTEYSTSQGDNRLEIWNDCGAPAKFSLTVTVR